MISSLRNDKPINQTTDSLRVKSVFRCYHNEQLLNSYLFEKLQN